MWYWALNIAFALWVFFDARSRKMDQSVLWAVGTFLLMIFVIPCYFAKRPLKDGEVREGGTAWNVLKSFAIFWTVFMSAAGVSGMMVASDVANKASSGAEQAGVAIGTAVGMGMVVGLWFVVMVGALVFGVFLKKSSIVEKGPTGALALEGRQETQPPDASVTAAAPTTSARELAPAGNVPKASNSNAKIIGIAVLASLVVAGLVSFAILKVADRPQDAAMVSPQSSAFKESKKGLPQRPRQISIEASDMQVTDPANPGLMMLTATLRNQALDTISYPALDVVLINTKQHTVARRIFLPAEYLDTDKDPLVGIQPNAEISVRLNFDTGDLGAAGFRLDLLSTENDGNKDLLQKSPDKVKLLKPGTPSADRKDNVSLFLADCLDFRAAVAKTSGGMNDAEAQEYAKKECQDEVRDFSACIQTGRALLACADEASPTGEGDSKERWRRLTARAAPN